MKPEKIVERDYSQIHTDNLLAGIFMATTSFTVQRMREKLAKVRTR